MGTVIPTEYLSNCEKSLIEMANQNNLIRPPVLPSSSAPNPNPNQQNAQLSIQDLTALISRISTDILRNEGPQVVQAILNPNVGVDHVSDQRIEDGHANNLNELDKIPDVVKCLKEFSGQPGEFSSWKKSVDRILSIYEPLKGTPKYYGIISVIRNKITGNADIALESYNTPLNWSAISQCLMTHYGDKRDVSTLEYQMSTLIQGNNSVSEFYQRVYTHLSLILNKIGCIDTSNESLILLTKSYREKALDTFIRGLNGDLPRLLGMREPVDLPQALHLCLKLENQNFRANHTYNSKKQQFSQQPPKRNFAPVQKRPFHPQLAYVPQIGQPAWQSRQQPFTNNSYNPPRPPKPQPRPEPMDVDQSLRSRRINYINRPQQNHFMGKRPPPSVSNLQRKAQRTFHINTESLPTHSRVGNYERDAEENSDTDNSGNYIEPTDLHFLA